MNYIRDHYKIIVFDILKVRIDLISNDSYVILKKIIEELYNIFNEYDKFIKYDIKLYNSQFVIRIKKKNKILDKFYIEFLIIVTLLSYSEIYKISTLKCLITFRLRL